MGQSYIEASLNAQGTQCKGQVVTLMEAVA